MEWMYTKTIFNISIGKGGGSFHYFLACFHRENGSFHQFCTGLGELQTWSRRHAEEKNALFLPGMNNKLKEIQF
jgi:hypothetical protein